MGYEEVTKSVLSQELEICRLVDSKVMKNYMSCFQKGILLDVAHVKAHRTKKGKEKMTKN